MGPEGSSIPFFIQIALIFGIFYFLVFRPQKKKQDDHKKMVNELKKNDQVITSGGVHGTVVIVKETTVVVRVDDSCRIEFDKEAITTVKTKDKK